MMGPKILGEKETKERILNRAFAMAGIVGYNEVKRIFAKYEALHKNCGNASERENIGTLLAVELHKAFNVQGELVVNGKLILPADKDFVPVEEDKNKIIPV